MQCGFCADACCQHGVDVSVVEQGRILAHADEIEARVGIRRSEWFDAEVTADGDFPGGASTRTTVRDGRCVFLSRTTRGCTLHAMSLDAGTDYHLLKPMVSALFPVTFGGEMLFCSEEIEDGSLVCISDGPTVYEMARPELLYYFGEEFVAELDALSVAPALPTSAAV